MSGIIFRKVALEKLSSPEQLDLLMQGTEPKSWLALVALGGLLLVAVVWSMMGRIPTTVSGTAILLNSEGIKNIITTEAGQLTALYIQAGDSIEEGQLVAEVRPLDSTESQPVYSTYTGRILELKVNPGDVLLLGNALASLELVGDEIQLGAIMYVSAAEGKKIAPGMTARIAPSIVETEEVGYLLGEVSSVGTFPMTYQGIFRTLGSDSLMAALVTDQAPIEVRIHLQPDASTVSGYRWSSVQGPGFLMSSGTLSTVTITVDERRPIELVLPVR
jgi:biotin carboxyl carrier protein